MEEAVREAHYCQFDPPFATVSLDRDGRATMKRDMDLIRRILLLVEARKEIGPFKVDFDDEPDKVKIFRHVELLCEADLLRRSGSMQAPRFPFGPPELNVSDLSWEGHEFLASLKTETVWERMKAKFTPDQIAAMPLGALKSVAMALAIEWAKQHAGFR